VIVSKNLVMFGGFDGEFHDDLNIMNIEIMSDEITKSYKLV
jgi:hypothetical protein